MAVILFSALSENAESLKTSANKTGMYRGINVLGLVEHPSEQHRLAFNWDSKFIISFRCQSCMYFWNFGIARWL